MDEPTPFGMYDPAAVRRLHRARHLLLAQLHGVPCIVDALLHLVACLVEGVGDRALHLVGAALCPVPGPPRPPVPRPTRLPAALRREE